MQSLFVPFQGFIGEPGPRGATGPSGDLVRNTLSNLKRNNNPSVTAIQASGYAALFSLFLALVLAGRARQRWSSRASWTFWRTCEFMRSGIVYLCLQECVCG